MNALTMAYNDGCDIITLSLGGVQGWASEPLGVTASNIAAKGTILTIAAGSSALASHGGYITNGI